MNRQFFVYGLATVSIFGSLCLAAIATDLKQHPNLSLLHQTVSADEQITAMPPPDRSQPLHEPRDGEGRTRN